MMDNRGCFALMLGDESQADGMSSAISSEGVVILSGHWSWHTEPRAKRQTCIDEVDFDIDAQPGDDPQNGQ